MTTQPDATAPLAPPQPTGAAGRRGPFQPGERVQLPDAREPDPAPRPKAIGSIPATMAIVVIRIGRSRTWLAWTMAVWRSNPSARSVLV